MIELFDINPAEKNEVRADINSKDSLALEKGFPKTVWEVSKVDLQHEGEENAVVLIDTDLHWTTPWY